MPFNTLLQKTGLVAILRGVKPDEIVAIGEKLYAAGFRLIEIPMNSPEAYKVSVYCATPCLRTAWSEPELCFR